MGRGSRVSRRTAVVAAAALGAAWTGGPAGAAALVPISLAGSTLAENAMNTWAAQVAADGEHVSFAGVGSTAGASGFEQDTLDGAVVDAQFADGSAGFPLTRPHTFVPLVASAVTFAYHLQTASGPVTGLRLSPSLIGKIVSRAVTSWNDPLIAAENPGLVLPALAITPVVRSDSASTSDEVGRWLSRTAPADWDRMCVGAGLAAGCAPGPFFPTSPTEVSLAGAVNTTAYVAQSYGNGAITYVESSYASYSGLQTAAIENAAGFYSPPTTANADVALEFAKADPTTGVVDLDAASAAPDPRAYPVETLSYLMAPTTLDGGFSLDKGTTMRLFADYGVCGPQTADISLGYTPLTGNLQSAARSALGRIPASPAVPGSAPCVAGGDALVAADPMPSAGAPAPASETLGTVLPPGALVISVSGDPQVTLPSPVLNDAGTDLRTSGRMTPVVVTDTRPGTTGWSLSGQAGDFADQAGHTIDAGWLSWQPQVLRSPAASPAVAGPAIQPGTGGLKNARLLATGEVGTTEVGAELDLDAPTTTVAGTYVATLTITAI